MSDKYRQYSSGGRGHTPWTSSPTSYARNANVADVRNAGYTQNYSNNNNNNNNNNHHNNHIQQQRYYDSNDIPDATLDLDKYRISQPPVVNKPANAVLSVLELKAITAARIAQQQEQARLRKEYNSNSDTYSTSSEESSRRYEDVNNRVHSRHSKVGTSIPSKPVTNAVTAPIVNAVVEGGMSVQDLKALTKLRLSSSDSLPASVESGMNYNRDVKGEYYTHFNEKSDYNFNINPNARVKPNIYTNLNTMIDYNSDTSVSSITSGITTSSDTYDHILKPNYGSKIPVINTQRVQLANLINDIDIKHPPPAGFNSIESKLMGNNVDIPLRSGNSILQPRMMSDHMLGFPSNITFDNSIAFELAESVLKSPNVSSHGGSIHGGSLHGGSLHGGSLSNSINGNTIRVNDLNLSSHSTDGKRSPRGIRVSK